MAKSKLIVSDPETGKATMLELTPDQFRVFNGLKLCSDLDGASLGLEGKIRLTGGSDSAGFPMRSDVHGGVKKYVLLSRGVGLREKYDGLKKRKMVRGNTITEDIYQINAVFIKTEKHEKAPKIENKKSVTKAVKKTAKP